MKSTYRVLAYLLAFEVVVQASAIAFALFGFGKWIDEGNTFDKSVLEDNLAKFTGDIGFPIHFINGQMVIPLIAIILLIVSFFAKIPGGTKWALILVVAIAAQVLVGIFGGGLPALGIFHGANALFIFAAAAMAARRVSTVEAAPLTAEPV